MRCARALRATAISLSTVQDLHTVAQVGGWKSLTYLTAYHRATTEAQTEALAHIGSRILDSHKQLHDNMLSSDSDDSE